MNFYSKTLGELLSHGIGIDSMPITLWIVSESSLLSAYCSLKRKEPSPNCTPSTKSANSLDSFSSYVLSRSGSVSPFSSSSTSQSNIPKPNFKEYPPVSDEKNDDDEKAFSTLKIKSGEVKDALKARIQELSEP